MHPCRFSTRTQNVQRKQSMNSSKRRSRRLALYLLCIGVRPWAAGLQTQYNALEPGQRKLARKTGRRLIKERESIAKAIATLANPVVIQETRIVPLVVSQTRAQAREEAFKYTSRRWSALTPPCPSCRMGNGSQTILAHPGMGRRGLGKTARSQHIACLRVSRPARLLASRPLQRENQKA
jgi:hypothetical protein